MTTIKWLIYRLRRWLIERLLHNLYSPETLNDYYACWPVMRQYIASHEERIKQQHGFVQFRYNLNYWHNNCYEPPYVCLTAFM